MRKLTYVEIDIDVCGNVYGSAPCTAAIGVTGERKCFNSLKTCQDIANFNTGITTLRFAKPTSYLPRDIEAIPSVRDIAFTPAMISLGVNLGQRATLTVTFEDHPHSDAGFMSDPYRLERGYDPFQRGTFWGKFRARFPYIQGRALRVYRGELGQALEDMDVRYYVMDSFEGPNPDGTFSIVAKDILKLADNDRAQAPGLSDGFLTAAITDTAGSVTLSPAQVGLTYPASGIAAIGGSEVVRFQRLPPGQAPNCLLLLHCNGANAGILFPDSSSYNRTITRNGNVQTITNNLKFGTANASFDGVDDWLRLNGEAAFAFGTGDFTVSFWALNASAVQMVLLDWTPAGGGGVHLTIRKLATSNLVVVSIGGVDLITSTVDLPATGAVWRNVVVMRKAGQLYLWIDAQLQGQVASTQNLAVGAQRPIIGTNGTTVTAEEFQGRLDEIAIFNEAVFDPDNFPLLQAPFPDTATPDTFSIQRAQFNTPASAHSEQDRFQLCVFYDGESPATIIRDLLVTYADVPAEYIGLAAWENEVDQFLQRNYTALIAEPTGVNKLISELVEQAALAVWWDDATQRIELRVLRQIGSEATLIDEDILLTDTTGIKEQPEKRISQVWTYFALINPLVSLEETRNYRSTALTVDLQRQSNYGTPAVKKIFSRWIPQFGRDTALKLNDLILGRYKDPPRRFSFELFGPSSEEIFLGAGYNVEFRTLQDDTGARERIPIQITRLNPSIERFQIEAEEALFLAVDLGDLLNRVIIIDANTTAFNIREVHDSIFPEIVDPTGITLTVIVEAGVTVSAGRTVSAQETYSGNRWSNSNRAIDVGDWPPGLPITIQLAGDVRGSGGFGGKATGTIVSVREGGQNGGTAIYTRYPVTINVQTANAKIWGGGGGGGSRSGTNNNGAGGGGAGSLPGLGGIGSGGAAPGQDGTLTAGGLGGSNAGTGGAPGQPGVSQTLPGGLAGNAIDGISFVTLTGLTPDIVGPQIN